MWPWKRKSRDRELAFYRDDESHQWTAHGTTVDIAYWGPGLSDEEKPVGIGTFSCSCGVTTGPEPVAGWQEFMLDHLRETGVYRRVVEPQTRVAWLPLLERTELDKDINDYMYRGKW